MSVVTPGLRDRVRGIATPVALAMGRVGLTPNGLTLIGFGGTCVGATLAGVLIPARWQRRLYGTAHVSWEYTWTGRSLSIRIWVPGTIPPGAVEAAIHAAWPGCTVTTDDASPGRSRDQRTARSPMPGSRSRPASVTVNRAALVNRIDWARFRLVRNRGAPSLRPLRFPDREAKKFR